MHANEKLKYKHKKRSTLSFLRRHYSTINYHCCYYHWCFAVVIRNEKKKMSFSVLKVSPNHHHFVCSQRHGVMNIVFTYFFTRKIKM